MSGRRRLLGRLIASTALITSTLTLAPATPALAAGSWQSPSPACGPGSAGCTVQRGSQAGAQTAGVQPLNFLHSDGRKETFVIGTDNSLHHTWQRFRGDATWHPWTRIYYPARLDKYLASYDNTPGVRVKDQFGDTWCIRGPAWNTWFDC